MFLVNRLQSEYALGTSNEFFILILLFYIETFIWRLLRLRIDYVPAPVTQYSFLLCFINYLPSTCPCFKYYFWSAQQAVALAESAVECGD